MLKAVKHLHDHDLVHMDIKPENIFVTADNVCKLGDFGLVLDLTKVRVLSDCIILLFLLTLSKCFGSFYFPQS